MQLLGWDEPIDRESVWHQWRHANSRRCEVPDSRSWVRRSSAPSSGEREELGCPREPSLETTARQHWELDEVARASSVHYRTTPLQREWHHSAERWNAFCAAGDQIVRGVTDGFSRLQRRYQFRHYAAVAGYMRDRAVPMDFLFDIARELEAAFPDAPLFMEIVTDPEEGTEHLLISAATDLPVREALDRLRRFDEAWWLANVDRAHGQVCVDIEIR